MPSSSEIQVWVKASSCRLLLPFHPEESMFVEKQLLHKVTSFLIHPFHWTFDLILFAPRADRLGGSRFTHW